LHFWQVWATSDFFMATASGLAPSAKSPPPVTVPDDDKQRPASVRGEPDGLPLLSGWVRLYPANQQQPGDVPRVWLIATDLALHVRDGRASLWSDDVICVGSVEAAPPPARGFRVTMRVTKWSGCGAHQARAFPHAP
jgi:hypothetical protein